MEEFYFAVAGLFVIVLKAWHVETTVKSVNQSFSQLSLPHIPAHSPIYDALCSCLYLLGVMAFYRLLKAICQTLDCQPGEILEFRPEPVGSGVSDYS